MCLCIKGHMGCQEGPHVCEGGRSQSWGPIISGKEHLGWNQFKARLCLKLAEGHSGM